MLYWQYILLGIVLLPGIILAAVAQAKVNSAYHYFSKVKAKSGIKAKDAARRVLDGANLEQVTINVIHGKLTDNYSPSKNCVSLSEEVAESDSIAALGIALHEVGHAIQHNRKYFPAKLRNGAVRFTNFVSTLLWPMVILGILFNFLWLDGLLGMIFILAGVVFFFLAIVINLITLPVEYNASNRALKILREAQILDSTELPGCKKVLRAAGLTYVAALVLGVLNLIRFLLLVIISRD